RQARAFPEPKQGLLAQRLAAVAPVLEYLARQRDVDGTDLLACVALRAERVRQVGLIQPVVEGRKHEADRTVVDVPELVAADGHERGAGIGASAAANARERVAKLGVCEHLRAAVVE